MLQRPEGIEIGAVSFSPLAATVPFLLRASADLLPSLASATTLLRTCPSISTGSSEAYKCRNPPRGWIAELLLFSTETSNNGCVFYGKHILSSVSVDCADWRSFVHRCLAFGAAEGESFQDLEICFVGHCSTRRHSKCCRFLRHSNRHAGCFLFSGVGVVRVGTVA
jgi:hypothetical protein